MKLGRWVSVGILLATSSLPAAAAEADLHAQIDQLTAEMNGTLVEDRRWLHQHPELSNREVNTAAYVAKRLKKLGLKLQTGVAKTGIVAILEGGKPGPVIALRSDMDALPVVEEVDLPFKSKVRSTYDGKDVGVMHACGHDGHMSILMGVAEVASKLKAQWPGTLKLIFQPAEEGAPDGEEGGAELMVKEGVMSSAPKPEVVFGLHLFSQWDVGQLAVRSGGAMASSDDLDIVVHGKQTHGARPWAGIDPIVVSAQIIEGLQTITSRQMDISQAPVVVTIGKIDGGVRSNIIPDSVTMRGTLRALDTGMQKDMQERVIRTVTKIAESAGTTADVSIGKDHAYPVTYNDPALTKAMLPTMQRVVGENNVLDVPPMLGAEDFSFFAREVPGLFVFVGVRTPGQPAADWAANHSPRFHIDEASLAVGVRTLSNLALDYATAHQK
ncbi:MAG: N-acyl-L-amino acid amidohydrolase [Hydrocarboniphaga sp.]|uniref:amidohydrolase n=1 Tax=Hydrocarboniphaga sp. TaxID=2033016 RepID=UPI002621534B|nr:amidohydrolase [Hydrocarboniphaga sp.]MDB5970736.1 N-acyl-L-amino acid amidohydrolase [Hydrocarboniphaga sp.]